MRLLLDTCAVIWSANGDAISDAARSAMLAAFEAGTPLFICPITAWEVGMLVARGRITIAGRPEDWFARVIGTPGTALADLPPDTMINSSFLPGTPPNDPADRMIIATARDQHLTILTRDRCILDYAEEGHVMAMPC